MPEPTSAHDYGCASENKQELHTKLEPIASMPEPVPASTYFSDDIDLVLLRVERDQLEEKCRKLEKELSEARTRLSYAFVKGRDGLLTHYTGLPSSFEFEALLGLLLRFTFVYYSGWTVKILSSADQLLMTLMKIR